jgi:DNA-binding NarL/FixJ family response regulator
MCSAFTLYIVEDSPEIQARLARELAGVPGLDVVGTATDVEPAIAGLRALKPDAAIIDLGLPHGSGLDVLRAVHDDLPALQAVVFTNFSGEPYRAAALRAGASEFLDKTEDFPRLRPLIERWSATHRDNALRSAS